MSLKQRVMVGFLMMAGWAFGQQVEKPPDERVEGIPSDGEDQSPADFLASREELMNLLNGGTTDDFERYVVADGNAETLNIFDLSDATVANGQGPNLVNPGVIYFSAEKIQWNGRTYFGLPSRAISTSANSIGFSYEGMTQVMGIDLHAYAGFSDTVTVRVFSPDGVLLGSTAVTLPNDASPAFVGFRHDDGIGALEVISQTRSFSAVLDNHSFGVMCASDRCEGTEELAAKVREKSCGCQVQAILKHGAVGKDYGFLMPDGECLSAEANRKGKAKVKQCPSRGGKVLVSSCGLEARVRCP
ncbi:MAG: hypothetical protein IT449_02790 [Phycisphaerales bacterium]|nr:hypothetical protein [Phycisphaerales bacterium]